MLVALVAFVAAPVGQGEPGAAAEAVTAPGSSGSAPGHDAAGPGNSENAPGHDAAGPGNSENAPGHEAEQAASIEQSAGATAVAEQDRVGNTHVTVRVDEPGNGTPITQENRAEADAAASTEAGSSGPATSAQSAQADAEAAQSDVANTVVSVRVGSPGDDAVVDQANAAGASSSTSVASPGGGASETEETSAAVAGQDGVSNTNVSVRVFSAGDDGPVTQRNEAVALAETSGPEGAAATATQDGVFNTTVSIRVESPGSSGPVVQESHATASAGSRDATDTVAVALATTDGADTSLALAVDGDALQQPGAGLQVWEWTWVWQHDESESLAALLGTASTSWTWIWGAEQGNPGERRGEVRSRAAREDERAEGTWDWRWSWTREGVSNWTWQWDWQGTLDCHGCIWIWDWSWSWTGQPAASSSTTQTQAPGPAAGASTSGQSNAAVAHAEASVTADVAQNVRQDGDGGQFAGQIADVLQIAVADAAARQVDVESIAIGPETAAQANVVWSGATVALEGELAQLVDQTMHVENEATGSQWSGQEIEVVQLGSAEASATQRHASLGGAGVHRASGRASVDGTADVEQTVAQTALAGGGAFDQWAGQLALVEQVNEAVSIVDQTGSPKSRLVGGTARASSGAGALARVDQSAEQHTARSSGVGSQSAAQAVFVGQDATAQATTVQRAGTAAPPIAASDATAANRALVVQEATQELLGSSTLDIQELVQQSIVLQSAVAASTSAGGIAGTAVVVNCAITQQTAGQSLATGRAAGQSQDLSAFCFPPAAMEAPAPQPDPASPTLSAAAGPVAPAAPGEAALATPLGETDTALFHGRPSTKAPRARAIAQRDPAARPEPGGRRSASGSPSVTQVSVPPSPQARLDTRPGSTAGAGDAGREPPLPPAGDPPTWISALAAAAAGAGGSGIAAILLAFALVPPFLLRALEGSVVRRPTDVLARVEVPI